jgi:hypothetical protein
MLEETLTVYVLVMDWGGISGHDAPEFEILGEESENRKHAITLNTEGAGGTALSAAATFPQDGRSGGDAPSKGPSISSAAMVGDEQGRGVGILKVCF